MGINDLKPHLPTTIVNVYDHLRGYPCVVDVANIIFIGNIRHAQAHFCGEDQPALADYDPSRP